MIEVVFQPTRSHLSGLMNKVTFRNHDHVPTTCDVGDYGGRLIEESNGFGEVFLD